MKVLGAGEGVRLVRDVLIPMRDGVRLAADLYVPDAGDGRGGSGDPGLPAEPLPVVMEYLPYRKDEVDPGGTVRHYLELPRNGYILARVDIRGTGGSQGHAVDEYVAQEQEDGYDAIEWIAAQPWCDGHVNMIGISYGGFTALQVATLQPPHLTSIIPVDFTDDRYTDDCHYRGGLMRMYYDVGYYGTRMVAWNAMPTDPTFSGDGAREIWKRHVTEDEPYLLAWFRHQVDGPYWRQGSVGDIADRIVCPTFLIGGWRDGYPNPPIRLFERLPGPKRLLIGPWDHRYPDAGIPGPRIDHLREVVRWLDRWCRGRDDGFADTPPIVVFMQEAGSLAPDRLESAGQWRAEPAWPPAATTERSFELGPEGRLAEATAHGGSVEADAPGPDRLVVDPSVGLTNGLWSGGVQFGLPGDQRPDEALSLTYTTAPLDAPLSILGRARADLHVAASVAVLGVAVSLCDVAPDGASHLVAKGMLNGTRRSSLTDPEPLVPGEVVPLTIEIDATAWRFNAGHRIRVSIAGADFPNVWPTPSPATLELHRSAEARSRIVLPVVPDDGPIAPPAFAPSPVVVRHVSAFDPPASWTVTRDGLTGRVASEIQFQTVHVTPDGTRIERDAQSTCEVDPRDPAHAVVRAMHRCVSGRDGHAVESRAETIMAGTATAFDVTIDLVVTVDDEPPVERRWVERIPRELL
jgi:putative CocE/NonD family hydrolase